MPSNYTEQLDEAANLHVRNTKHHLQMGGTREIDFKAGAAFAKAYEQGEK